MHLLIKVIQICYFNRSSFIILITFLLLSERRNVPANLEQIPNMKFQETPSG